MNLCLTPEEIKAVTGKKRFSAQRRALRTMGIESRVRPDGSTLVDRRHYVAWANGTLGKEGKTDETTYPKWAA